MIKNKVSLNIMWLICEQCLWDHNNIKLNIDLTKSCNIANTGKDRRERFKHGEDSQGTIRPLPR